MCSWFTCYYTGTQYEAGSDVTREARSVTLVQVLLEACNVMLVHVLLEACNVMLVHVLLQKHEMRCWFMCY